MADNTITPRAPDLARISELEAALRLIEEKSQDAVDYLEGSGEMLFLQYAQGCLDTARNALRKD